MKNLVAGVTRWRRRLDFVLDELTGHRVGQVQTPVHPMLQAHFRHATSSRAWAPAMPVRHCLRGCNLDH